MRFDQLGKLNNINLGRTAVMNSRSDGSRPPRRNSKHIIISNLFFFNPLLIFTFLKFLERRKRDPEGQSDLLDEATNPLLRGVCQRSDDQRVRPRLGLQA